MPSKLAFSSSWHCTRMLPHEYVSAYFLSNGIRPTIGTPTFSAQSAMIRSFPPERFTTIPVGIPILSVIAAANFRSFSPNGVGSVSKTATSALSSALTTGHAVPGEASRILTASGSMWCLTACTTLGASASPIFSSPCAKKKGLFSGAACTFPMGTGFSRNASSGHT